MVSPADIISSVFASVADNPTWLAWNWEGSAKRKRPFGKSDDPSTWKTLTEARAAEKLLGLVLTDRELCGGIVCVDLDGCRDPETGEVSGWAEERLNRLGSYAEISPSGTGIKVYLVAGDGQFVDRKQRVPGDKVGGKQPGIELFAGEGARYVAVTGDHLPNTPLSLTTIDGQSWAALLPAANVVAAGGRPETTSIEQLQDALSFLPADDSMVWEKVTQALKWTADTATLEPDAVHRLWVDWSKTAPDHFDERNNESRWRSFRQDGTSRKAVSIRTLFYLAKRHGWTGSGNAVLGFPDLTVNGGLRNTVPNVVVALALIGIDVRSDLFKGREYIGGHALAEFAGDLQDPVIHRLRELIHEEFRIHPARETMLDAIHTVGNHHRFHPVQDYLDGLNWDGVPRLDKWLIDYGGADDTEFNRAVGAIFLTAAVRRVRQPGCKFDEVLVLESPQGRNKSQALAVMAVDQSWFTDQSPLGKQDRETVEVLAGRWIIEIAELKGMRNAEIEAVKAFASRQVDSGRMAYAMTRTDAPRQCVFFATTNDTQYLRDQTGNRRFWPVKIERFDLDALRRDRDQLWAEAAHREANNKNESLIRLPEDLWEAAAEQQAARMVENQFLPDLDDLLRETSDLKKGVWVEGKPLEGKVSVPDLMAALDLPPNRRSQNQTELVAAAMRELGWRKPENATGKLRVNGSKPRAVWIRGEGPEFRSISIDPPYLADGQRIPPRAYYTDKPPPSGVRGQD